jgi:hypothetical protein
MGPTKRELKGPSEAHQNLRPRVKYLLAGAPETIQRAPLKCRQRFPRSQLFRAAAVSFGGFSNFIRSERRIPALPAEGHLDPGDCRAGSAGIRLMVK